MGDRDPGRGRRSEQRGRSSHGAARAAGARRRARSPELGRAAAATGAGEFGAGPRGGRARHPALAARLRRSRALSVFADSSALVKLYADERDADSVRALTQLVVSLLARVEIPAAFWRKQRLGEISALDAAVLTAAFEADLLDPEAPRFVAVAISAPILTRAARLCASHGLRAYDAVQLSCALTARDADPGCESFACFDADLRDAAAAHGLSPFPEKLA